MVRNFQPVSQIGCKVLQSLQSSKIFGLGYPRCDRTLSSFSDAHARAPTTLQPGPANQEQPKWMPTLAHTGFHTPELGRCTKRKVWAHACSVFVQTCATCPRCFMPPSCPFLSEAELSPTPTFCPANLTCASSPCLDVWHLNVRTFVQHAPRSKEALPTVVTGTSSIRAEGPSLLCEPG